MYYICHMYHYSSFFFFSPRQSFPLFKSIFYFSSSLGLSWGGLQGNDLV